MNAEATNSRVCANTDCQKPLSTQMHPNRKFCSEACQHARHKEAKAWAGHLSPGSAGALSELRASADLLFKGYEVFRAVSPSCSCDLIALKDGKTYRVEVRTGLKLQSGTLAYNRRDVKADILAVVLEDSILYQPELP